jgi:beta-glucuronidase
MSKFACFTPLVGFVFAAVSPALLHAAQPAAAVSLDGPWLFTIDYLRSGEAYGWYRETPPQQWDAVTVPHCWPLDPRFAYTGAAWYWRQFDVPAAFAGQHLRLRFEAVFYRSRVWVNGAAAGSHEGGYTPFELDVTKLIRPGEKNSIAVEADSAWDTTTLPGARTGPMPQQQSYPWWDYGGIVRDVTLLATPRVFVHRQKIEATPDLRTGTAAIHAVVWVANTQAEPAEVAVEVDVRKEGADDALRGSTQRRTVQLAAGAEQAIPFDITLAKADVALWQLDAPALYTLHATAGGHALDERFGIRKLEIRGTAILLNGEPIRVGGANRPADDPRFGLIEPAEVVDRDLKLMKEAGMELGRIVHYAPSLALLDWADRHGMLLILEAGNWQLQPDQMDSPVLRAKWRAQMRELIERDWNRPSVIGWSVGNEFPSQSAAGIRWVKDGYAFVRTLDANRFITFASMYAFRPGIAHPEDEASNFVDVVMANTYGQGKDLDAALDRMHALWPNKPLLISEFGIRADQASVSRQEQYFRGFFASLRARPWISGASLWTFNDYRSRYPGSHADGYRWWGVVDGHRGKRPSYRWLREEMSPAVLDGAMNLRVRADFPSYTLRGYRARRTWLDAAQRALRSDEVALPDLAPGASHALRGAAPAGTASVRVEILRPTGFSMIDREYKGLSR